MRTQSTTLNFRNLFRSFSDVYPGVDVDLNEAKILSNPVDTLIFILLCFVFAFAYTYLGYEYLTEGANIVQSTFDGFTIIDSYTLTLLFPFLWVATLVGYAGVSSLSFFSFSKVVSSKYITMEGLNKIGKSKQGLITLISFATIITASAAILFLIGRMVFFLLPYLKQVASTPAGMF